ncbi:Imm17 family immunity protein [Fusobacterium sp. PH5-44]|uniref:Imm17 family immunity protein n=1 Tax=unclassified Fusobacterium TaxID=2648384 RepID=UPI003D1D5098
MDKILDNGGAFFKKHWYLVIGGCGLLLLLGAIFKWGWVLQTQGDRSMGFMQFVSRNFGETGYRIVMGILGILLILFAIGYPILLSQIK